MKTVVEKKFRYYRLSEKSKLNTFKNQIMSFDKSLLLHSTQRTPIKNNRVRQILGRDEALNLSPILNDTSLFKTLNDSSLRQVLDESSIVLNTGTAGSSLSELFFEIIQSSRPSDILDTLSRLAQACCDSLELVEPWNRYNAQNYWLAEEANTWRLLHALYSDSIAEGPDTFENIITQTTISQHTLVTALYRSDSEIRLLQLLVDWLEATAAYQDEATQTSAPVVGNNIHWGNTLHQLLIGSSLFNKDKNKAMITCMDPDAPRRQNKTIHSDDLKDDNDLCKRVFTEFRCGKYNEAVSLCISAGQAWRGAILQGWKLLHYEKREENSNTLELKGNKSRGLWKICGLAIANNTSENMFYRATVGLLCGHLQSAVPVCQGNWEDLLWAHLRVQIEAKVDKFLNEHHATAEANTTPPEVLELLQSELQVVEISLEQIFNAVKSLMDGKKESNYQTVQRYLMLGHIRSIMQDSTQWVDNTDERFIRFLAHLVLVLRHMGKDPQHDVGDMILEKYVLQLIENLVDGACESPQIIAYYTATVPRERQTLVFAEFMEKIHKSCYREGIVKAGLTAGIDVAESARLTIKRAITDTTQSYGNFDMNMTQTTAVEKEKDVVGKLISSLEWLSLLPNQIVEGLWLSNAMIRTFIFMGNTDAAIACLSSMKNLFSDFMNSVAKNSAELREHLCLKAYLDALDGFATWCRHYISGQPRDVEPLQPDASFADKVHHEQKCAQVEQQKARWKNATLHLSRNTKSLLYNVLKFPGGWLLDENDSTSSKYFSEDDREDRLKQMDTLRRLCIPEAVNLILKILQSNDNVDSHKEAVQLSNLIAAENRGLYKVFTKNKIQDLLERIKESCLVLMEKDRDMFGYELNE
ncbi:nuclear pore complex protein Nup107 [Leptidea sinapis]|uniref:nuclear pore complex protein Nup107 n=1 Tax=Leptidea sinapis TaxID=189913 RepID=UPI0021400B12|nr:nuclear pore complex protein Nup107 [Leptidea sinapis]